ncbi:hypothetical protein BJ912DRAFT_1047550 [Pholiota molesta]|nr:hypothetical protein BJ912DRAFT_1047550 [Pholiota molesta]
MSSRDANNGRPPPVHPDHGPALCATSSRGARHDDDGSAPFTTSSCGARHDDDGSAPTPLPSTVCAYNGAAHKAAPAAQRRIKGGFLTPFVAPIAGTLRVPTGIREQTGLPLGTCDPQVNDPRIRVIRGNKSLRVRVWLLAVEIPAGHRLSNVDHRILAQLLSATLQYFTVAFNTHTCEARASIRVRTMPVLWFKSRFSTDAIPVF